QTDNTRSFSYKSADLSDVTKALMPLMGELGLSFTAKPTFSGERFVLAYKLMHTNGDSEEGEYPLDMRGSPQQIGSAITYARRYALCAVTGLAADEDDDGHVATVAKTDKPRQPPRRGKNDPMMSE